MIHTRKVLRLKRQKLGLINKRKVNTSSSEMSVKRLNFLETKILFMKICNDNKPIIPFLGLYDFQEEGCANRRSGLSRIRGIVRFVFGFPECAERQFFKGF